MSKPTRFLAVEDLDATETLAAAEKIVHERRAVEVQEVEVALHWADRSRCTGPICTASFPQRANNARGRVDPDWSSSAA